MYRDSFSIFFLIPVLSEHFSQAVYLWGYPTDEVYNEVAIEKPDVVIIEFDGTLSGFFKLIYIK